MGFQFSMENKISFTGIRNIASVGFKREGFQRTQNLSMTLSDDFQGKDFEAFRNELKKLGSNSGQYINEEDSHVLNLEYRLGAENNRWIILNGKPLEENDSNLSMFSYLAKLMKTIIRKNDNEFVVNNDYKNYLAKDTLVSGMEINNYEQLVEEGFIDNCFDPLWVKKGAQKIASNIQDIMEAYLGIK